MIRYILYLFTSSLLCQRISADDDIPPYPYNWYHGTPVVPPTLQLIRQGCNADLSGQLNGATTGGTYECPPFTLVSEPNRYCDFVEGEALFVSATLHIQDTYTLYLLAGKLGDQLYDTTCTFSPSDAFSPKFIGCVRIGDGVATTVYSYSR